MENKDPMIEYDYSQKPIVKFILGIIFLASLGIIAGVVMFTTMEFVTGLYLLLASSGFIMICYMFLDLGKSIYAASNEARTRSRERRKKFHDMGLTEFERKQTVKRAEEIDLESSPYF